MFTANVHKLRCLFWFFTSLSTATASPELPPLVLQRAVASQSDHRMDWLNNDTKLAQLELASLHSSVDDVQCCVRVDFANAAVGGGVLLNTPGSTAQEEILFVTHPELIVAKLLTACMRDDEAVVMSGARHFCNHTGCLPMPRSEEL